MENSYNVHTQVNLIADDLKKTARALEKGTTENRTKAELIDIVKTALESVLRNSEKLIVYRSTLNNPVVPRDPSNSMFDELQKAVEDIGEVQFLIAKDKIREADELLQDVKTRL